MSELFPLGLPGATALYLSLYAVTLAIHVVLLGYVLGGTGVVALAALRGRDRASASGGGGLGTVAALLRDWLPFALGAAITAGVAPLLFLQILYREGFYTANLLLFHRWMAVVPVLLAGFYALYLAKTDRVAAWPRGRRAALALFTWGCFAFTAWSFTENHLLSIDRGAWVPHYADGRLLYTSPSLIPRVAMWIAGALPVMAVTLAWQVRARERRGGTDLAAAGTADAAAVRALAIAALAGLLAAGGAAAWYATTLTSTARDLLATPFAAPYTYLAAAGVAAQAGGWLWLARAGRVDGRALAAISAGAAATILGVIVAREALRLGTVELAPVLAQHERAAGAGGIAVFALFFAIVATAIALCIRMVRRGLREAQARDSTTR